MCLYCLLADWKAARTNMHKQNKPSHEALHLISFTKINCSLVYSKLVVNFARDEGSVRDPRKEIPKYDEGTTEI